MKNTKRAFAKTLPILLMFLPLVFTAGGLMAQEETFFSIRSTVLVGGETRAALIQATEDMGGYFTVNSNSTVSLRIPVDQVQDFQTLLTDLSQRVLSYEISSQSTRQQRQSTLAAIASREERLGRNLEYLDRTDVQGTLALEQEILSILSELEYYKGQLQVIENRNRFAEANVYFRVPQPVSPSAATTNFQWLSRINFYQFMERGLQ